ncbi:hypothetical protein D0Z00_001075 [Geotrichum galactomycetum]|uniref:Uncharacterized protein n=1 Tax=Geotrichum galactomycetum TaxID=27317 RepID=A0ACB6V853_9ASCO|nr:hypothetical protein D0Z00_001075 [Geotrichum candidum]
MLPINLKERFRPEEANAKSLKKKPKRGRPKKKLKSKGAKDSFKRAEIKQEQQQNDTPEYVSTPGPTLVKQVIPDDGTDKLHSLFIQNYEQDRLTDRTGKEIFCSVCHSSTISATPIARCEECDQNWHLTCTDPPLSKNLGVKLLCPNNGTHRLRKLRRPKNLTIHELELADKDKPDSEKLADDPWLLRKKTHEFHLKKRYVDNPKPGTNRAGLKDLVGGSVQWKQRASAARETPMEKETPTVSSSEDEAEDEDDDNEDEDENSDIENHIRHLPIHMYYDTPTGVVAPVLHNRFKQLERDGVVYRISARGIKADFIQAVYEMNQNPLPDSKNSEILLALDEIAGRDMHGVSRTVPNIELLVDCALGHDEPALVAAAPSTVAAVKTEDDPTLLELMAVKKLIDIRGKDALLKFLLK